MYLSLNENLKYTLATQAAERMKPSADTVRLCREVASGQITSEIAVAMTARKYGFSLKQSHYR